jgi:hypothetical protein
MIRAVIPALLLSGSAFNAYADCDTSLKQNDSYRELSEKLRCLADEIAALKQSLVSSPGMIKTSRNEPAEIQDCVVTSSLPKVTRFFLRANAKFCRDDGIVWLRIPSNLYAANNASSVGFNLIEDGKSPYCRPADSACILEDHKSGQKFNVFVEPGKDADGQSVWVGTFQRVSRQ